MTAPSAEKDKIIENDVSETVKVFFFTFEKKTFHQMLRFGAVGAGNTAICMGLAALLVHLNVIDYIANDTGYVVGFFISFFLNKFWTFKQKVFSFSEFLRFGLVFAIALFFNNMALLVIKNVAGFEGIIAIVLAAPFYTLFSFLGNKLFTFRK